MSYNCHVHSETCKSKTYHDLTVKKYGRCVSRKLNFQLNINDGSSSSYVEDRPRFVYYHTGLFWPSSTGCNVTCGQLEATWSEQFKCSSNRGRETLTGNTVTATTCHSSLFILLHVFIVFHTEFFRLIWDVNEGPLQVLQVTAGLLI